MAATAAQEEFKDLIASNARRDPVRRDDPDSSSDEESAHRNAQLDAAMRAPTASSELKLPPASFDSGCATGVKGVIADARAFQTARRSKWIDRAKSARRSILGMAAVVANGSRSESETDDDVRSTPGVDESDEEAFLQQWRESRRRELESDANQAIRNRRTSPSVRIYGRLDQVDAMGYLDAIKKVNRETRVVVFVADHEVRLSTRLMAPSLADPSRNSATSRPPSSRHCCPSSGRTRRCTLSRCTTTRSSLIRPPCPRFWPTATKETCSPT